jgi:GNAT superfamily N-acetyltransferase
MTVALEIRTLRISEIPSLIDWAAAEGWNPSPDDAGAFFAADRHGFLGGFWEGRLVAGISAVAYGERYGFIGLYLCHPDFRGKGYGMAVWKAGMQRLSGRTIGLDGVPAQQQNYESMGFRKAYQTARWSGRLPAHTEALGVMEATQVHLAQILSIDRQCFPENRDSFIRGWIAPPRHAFIIEQFGELLGYVVIRRCIEGFKIGPLFARDASSADALISACQSVTGDEMVHLDIPAVQTAFSAKLKRHGFTRGFETARMYLRTPPSTDIKGVYAITTLELG